MKNKILSIKLITGLLTISTVLSVMALPFTASAATLADGMNASYVLGAGGASQDFTTNSSGLTSSTFNEPRGVAYDTVNNWLFVGDRSNHRVLVFETDSSGTPTDHVADYVLGQPDFTTNTPTTTQSGIDKVRTLAYDSDRSLLFVDTHESQGGNGGHRIMVWDLSGGITNGMNASYVLLQPDFTSDTASVTQSTAIDTGQIAIDTVNDRLFARDSNRVLIFDVRDNGSPNSELCGETTNGLANGMNASCVLGQANFTATVATTTQSGLSDGVNENNGIAFDPNNELLFTGDGENSRVMVWDLSGVISNGMNASYVLGQTNFTSAVHNANLVLTADKFTSWNDVATQRGLSYDSINDRLFVGDAMGDRVMVFDMSGGVTNGMAASWVIGQSGFTVIDNAYTLVGYNRSNIGSVGHTAYFESGQKLYVAAGAGHRIMVWDLTPTATSGKGYVKPPVCSANFSPNTITKGESTDFSWSVTWPTEKYNTYYTRVPGKDGGLFSSRVSSLQMYPEHTQTITMYTFNLYGATPCKAMIKVLDAEGNEILPQNLNKLSMTAGVSNSPIVRTMLSFFSSIFAR